MRDRLIAGPHGEVPCQGGDKHLDCHRRGFVGTQAEAELPGTRPGRPIRGMILESRNARGGFRITHSEPETLLRDHDAGEVGAIAGQNIAGTRPGIPCARFNQGKGLQMKSVGRSRLKMRS